MSFNSDSVRSLRPLGVVGRGTSGDGACVFFVLFRLLRDWVGARFRYRHLQGAASFAYAIKTFQVRSPMVLLHPNRWVKDKGVCSRFLRLRHASSIWQRIVTRGRVLRARVDSVRRRVTINMIGVEATFGPRAQSYLAQVFQDPAFHPVLTGVKALRYQDVVFTYSVNVDVYGPLGVNASVCAFVPG